MVITLLISFALFVVAILAYSICDLDDHGKLRWESKNPFGFWGKFSDYRKYKWEFTGPPYGEIKRLPAPNNLYYKLLKIKYKEKWFTSATATVFLTDGWHLMQAVFINCLLLSFALLAHNTLLWFIVFRVLWFITFNPAYSLFSKKQK